MPYFYKIDRAVDVIFISHIGRVTSADFCEQLEEILQHDEFSKGQRLLIDQREEVPPAFSNPLNEKNGATEEQNQSRLGNIFSQFGKIKLACIFDEDVIDYFDGVIKLIAGIPNIEHGVFSELNGATKWLDIHPDFDFEKILNDIIFAYHRLTSPTG
jgi:hypothetical protein